MCRTRKPVIKYKIPNLGPDIRHSDLLFFTLKIVYVSSVSQEKNMPVEKSREKEKCVLLCGADPVFLEFIHTHASCVGCYYCSALHPASCATRCFWGQLNFWLTIRTNRWIVVLSSKTSDLSQRKATIGYLWPWRWFGHFSSLCTPQFNSGDDQCNEAYNCHDHKPRLRRFR